jgi:hypothetical protein
MIKRWVSVGSLNISKTKWRKFRNLVKKFNIPARVNVPWTNIIYDILCLGKWQTGSEIYGAGPYINVEIVGSPKINIPKTLNALEVYVSDDDLVKIASIK